MAFQFGFTEPDIDDTNNFFAQIDDKKGHQNIVKSQEANILKLPFKQIFPTDYNLWHTTINEIDPIQLGQLIISDDCTLCYIQTDYGEHEFENHADLIPGIYEGGAKIWECTLDLANFLVKKSNNILDNLQEMVVLDLGCGAGILGILAIRADASRVYFHDYNDDVLLKVTLKNIQLNISETIYRSKNRCNFISGDWEKYTEALYSELIINESHKFDVILTSETIYNPQNYKHLLNIFKATLKPTGVVYLAAKTYYFGVGGGLREFEKFVQNDGDFHSQIVWSTSENVSREILKITRKL